MTCLIQLFNCVYRVSVYFRILISKNHWTASEFRKLRSLHNEDAEILLIGHRPRFCILWAWDGRCSKEDVLRGGSVRGRLSGRGGAIVDTTERWSIAAGQSRHVGRMESCWWHWHLGRFQDLRLQVPCTLLQTDHYHCNWFKIMLLVWVPIVLERAKSSILPNGNFREFFLWRGENFAFSKQEFPVALMRGPFREDTEFWVSCSLVSNNSAMHSQIVKNEIWYADALWVPGGRGMGNILLFVICTIMADVTMR